MASSDGSLDALQRIEGGSAQFLDVGASPAYEGWTFADGLEPQSLFDQLQIFLPGIVERQWARIIPSVRVVHHAPARMLRLRLVEGRPDRVQRTLSHEVGAAGMTVNAVGPPLVETPSVAVGPQREMGGFEIVVNAQAIKREGKVDYIAGVYSFRLGRRRNDYRTDRVRGRRGRPLLALPFRHA